MKFFLTLIISIFTLTSIAQHNIDLGLHGHLNGDLKPVITYKFDAWSWSYGASYGVYHSFKRGSSHDLKLIAGPSFSDLSIEFAVGINYGLKPYSTNFKQFTFKGRVIHPIGSLTFRQRVNDRLVVTLGAAIPGVLQAGVHVNLFNSTRNQKKNEKYNFTSYNTCKVMR